MSDDVVHFNAYARPVDGVGRFMFSGCPSVCPGGDILRPGLPSTSGLLSLE